MDREAIVVEKTKSRVKLKLYVNIERCGRIFIMNRVRGEGDG